MLMGFDVDEIKTYIPPTIRHKPTTIKKLLITELTIFTTKE